MRYLTVHVFCKILKKYTSNALWIRLVSVLVDFLFDMQISLILKIQSLYVWKSSCENFSLLAAAKCHIVWKMIVIQFRPKTDLSPVLKKWHRACVHYTSGSAYTTPDFIFRISSPSSVARLASLPLWNILGRLASVSYLPRRDRWSPPLWPGIYGLHTEHLGLSPKVFRMLWLDRRALVS